MSSEPPKPKPEPFLPSEVGVKARVVAPARLGDAERYPNLRGEVSQDVDFALVKAYEYIYQLGRELRAEEGEKKKTPLLTVAGISEIIEEEPEPPEALVKSYFVGVAVLTDGQFAGTNTAPVATANEIRVWAFPLPMKMSVNRISINRTTGPAGAPQRYDVGLYNQNGALLLHSGAKNVQGLSPGVDNFNIPLVVIEPGMLLLALTADVGSNAIGFSSFASGGGVAARASLVHSWFNFVEPVYYAKSSTASSGGVLPGIIGELSTTGTVAPHQQAPYVVFAEV